MRAGSRFRSRRTCCRREWPIRIYLLDGLLQKASNPDELAGIIAHELGHVQHRDGMRRLIQTGGTSFLFGLLFGDVTGAGAVIFVGRAMLDASYSRDAERGADAFATEVMHKLGRSPAPSGYLLFRITGAQADKSLTILASHPLTEERLAEMVKADRPATGPGPNGPSSRAFAVGGHRVPPRALRQIPRQARAPTLRKGPRSRGEPRPEPGRLSRLVQFWTTLRRRHPHGRLRFPLCRQASVPPIFTCHFRRFGSVPISGGRIWPRHCIPSRKRFQP
jgi:hypothetical protein